MPQDVDRAVGHGGHLVQAGVEAHDVALLELVDPQVSEDRHDVLAHHEGVVAHGQGLAAVCDMLALKSRGQVGAAVGSGSTAGLPSLMRAMTSVASLRSWAVVMGLPCSPMVTRLERPKARVWTT